MNMRPNRSSNAIFMTLALCAFVTLPVLAQPGRIDISSINYSAIASETAEISLDGPMLLVAAKFMASEDPEIAGLIKNLDGIYVKSFSFDDPGAYDMSDVEAIRRQIGPMWQLVVKVREKGGEDVDIFMLPEGSGVGGVVIIAAEKYELTIVNLVGPVDLERLSELENQFGIPAMGLDGDEGGDL